MASTHKDLLMAIKHWQLHPDVDSEHELVEAIVQSELYLSQTKSFEYSGKIEMMNTNIIKCADIRSDLDDIVRAMNNGKRQVERTGYICIMLDTIPVPTEPPPAVQGPVIEEGMVA